MTGMRVLTACRSVVWTMGLYLAGLLLVQIFYPELVPTLWLGKKRLFDVGHYLQIATSGYQNGTQAAFYPLWPLVLSPLNSLRPEVMTAAANLLALGCFVLCLRPLERLGLTMTSKDIAWWMVLGFGLNPMSVFHSMAYTESWFSLLAVCWCFAFLQFQTQGATRAGLWLAAWSFMLSLSRPVYLTLPLSVVCALLCTRRKASWPAAVWVSLGAMCAQFLYGVYAAGRWGHFWQPTLAQQDWGRSFSLHWDLILAPESVGGSNIVLVWDLAAFWLPVLGLLLLLRAKVQEALPWIALFFAAAHGGIAFLTYDKFMSLGRHVFAVPFFFLGMATALERNFGVRHARQALRIFAGVSFLYLLHFWSRLAKGSWMG